MHPSDSLSSPVEVAGFAYVVGIDIGSQSALYCICQPDKSQVAKPTEVPKSRAGLEALEQHWRQLAVPPEHILIGREATGHDSEHLDHLLREHGYRLRPVHPQQTHQFAKQRGLRAKTDRLDATTIARLLLSGEARPGYVPDELISTYRELERLHSQLTADSARYQHEIQALLVVLFPEFVQVCADPCRPTALGVLKRYPGAQAILDAGVEALTSTLRELAPRHYGRRTAQALVRLAAQSVATPLASSGRALSLKVLCDQPEHTLAKLAQVERQLDQMLDADPGASGLTSTPSLAARPARCRVPSWAMCRALPALTRSLPMSGWTCKSARAVSGRDRSSSPNAAVAASGKCSPWPLCARSRCLLRRSRPTIVAWSLVGSNPARP